MSDSPLSTTGQGLVLAIVGAESTGKSTLAHALALRLAEATGWRTAFVDEYLRHWCAQTGRTPTAAEQVHIAHTQTQRIGQARSEHDLVVCDTTALMTAVYSRHVFDDNTLWSAALVHHAQVHFTLLTALDLPWVADGHQRDGAHVREPVDRLLREGLSELGATWALVTGQGVDRLECAMDAVSPWLRTYRSPRTGLLTRLQEQQERMPQWTWTCENCDDPVCEHLSAKRYSRAMGHLPTPESNT